MLPCARSCTFRGAQARLLAVPRNLKNALTNLGDKASKVVPPSATDHRLLEAIFFMARIALYYARFSKTLQNGELYEEFASRTDSLVAGLNQLIFDLAQEVRSELGIEKIKLTDIQRKTLYGSRPLTLQRHGLPPTGIENLSAMLERLSLDGRLSLPKTCALRLRRDRMQQCAA